MSRTLFFLIPWVNFCKKSWLPCSLVLIYEVSNLNDVGLLESFVGYTYTQRGWLIGISFSFPILHSAWPATDSLYLRMLLHTHDAEAEDFHEKKKKMSNIGKYLPLKVLATKVFGFWAILQTCLTIIASFMIFVFQLPSTPSSLGWHRVCLSNAIFLSWYHVPNR